MRDPDRVQDVILEVEPFLQASPDAVGDNQHTPVVDVPSTTGQLVELSDVYYVEVPTEQARALALEGGEAVAWRFTIRDGAVAVVADLDVDAVEEDAPHVRRMQSHMSGREGSDKSCRAGFVIQELREVTKLNR